MDKIECAVGDTFHVESGGTFRLAANKRGLYLVPDDSIKLVRLSGNLSRQSREKIDRCRRNRII